MKPLKPHPDQDTMVALLPALLLATSAFWSGTFQAPMWPQGVLLGHVLLALVVAGVGANWRDPLQLGDKRRWLPWLICIWVWLGVLASPLPRVGWAAAALLPVFVLLPSAVARCWSTRWQRRIGLRAIAVVVGAASVYGLMDAFFGGEGRMALPLGHHNLQGQWLLCLLPLLTTLYGRRRTWRSTWMRHMTTLGLVAIVATRSLAAVGGLIAVSVCSVWIYWKARRWPGAKERGSVLVEALGLFMLLGFVLTSYQTRILGILAGEDSSGTARWSYWQGAWEGFLARPFGWGAGSTPWTLAEFLPVKPGVLPPSQIVADVHNLPLSLLFELGWPGLLLVLWTWVALGRSLSCSGYLTALRQWPALAALVVLAVTTLGGASLSVLALPTALAIAIGSGLRPEPRAAARPWRGRVGLPPVVVSSLALAVLVPLDWAAVLYGRAIDSNDLAEQQAYLEEAVEQDPKFPLYAAQLALFAAQDEPAAAPSSDWWLRDESHSLASLWLWTGFLAADVDEQHASWLRACDLDPLAAMAPYLLAVEESSARREVRSSHAARALIAEPRLLLALEWRHRPQVLKQAVQRLAEDPRIDAGWRQRLLDTDEWLRGSRQAESSDVRELALRIDADPVASLSLHAFRRAPWSTVLTTVELDGDLLEDLDLAPLALLRTTDPQLFGKGCLLSEP